MKVTRNNILCPILHWFSIHSVRRDANSVAHVLARYARHISFDVFCLEDSSPPPHPPHPPPNEGFVFRFGSFTFINDDCSVDKKELKI